MVQYKDKNTEGTMADIRIGGRYRHYKGNEYVVIGIASTAKRLRRW